MADVADLKIGQTAMEERLTSKMLTLHEDTIARLRTISEAQGGVPEEMRPKTMTTRTRQRGLFTLLALVAALAPPSVSAQQSARESGLRLAEVAVVGASRYTPAEVTKVSGLTVGQSVTPDGLTAAAERMSATGLFKSVKYRYENTGVRMTVTFEIEEAPWTMPVLFDNVVWLSDEELVAAMRQEVPSFDGTSPKLAGAPDFIAKGLQHMLEAHHIPGRVEFLPTMDLRTKTEQYLFSVKDPSPKTCTLHVAGASAVPERELVAAVHDVVGTDYSRSRMTAVSTGTLLYLYHQRGGAPSRALELRHTGVLARGQHLQPAPRRCGPPCRI